MGFNTASVWLKVALVCLGLGTLLFIIGFATNSWMVTSWGTTRFGLWTIHQCFRDNLVTRRTYCKDGEVTQRYLELLEHNYREDFVGFYRATQVFECLGLICTALALLIILIYVFIDRMRKRSALIGIIVLSFIAVVCMVIGFAVFATQFPLRGYDVGWSMGIAIAGCVVIFIGAVMSVLELKK